MNKKQLFVYGASILAATLAGGADAQQADERYVQVAEIEIDPDQLAVRHDRSQRQQVVARGATDVEHPAPRHRRRLEPGHRRHDAHVVRPRHGYRAVRERHLVVTGFDLCLG